MVFIGNCILKAVSGKLLFMVNPCHMYLVDTANELTCCYVLSRERSTSTIKITNHLFSLLFAPWTGTLFADLYGMHLPLEVELFYGEHGLALLGLPMIMLS